MKKVIIVKKNIECRLEKRYARASPKGTMDKILRNLSCQGPSYQSLEQPRDTVL